MSFRKVVAAVVLFLSAELALARIANAPGYKTMSEQADLIVIATPTDNADLPGATTVPGIASVSKDGKQREIPATRVQTTFKPTAILKGTLPDNSATFKLIHLKLVDPADANSRVAAQLVEFKPADRAQYLMFLKASADGTYEPFTGQVDPVYSIEKLQQSARPGE